MKKYLLFLSLGLLVACNKPAETSSTTTTDPVAVTDANTTSSAATEPMEQTPEVPAADMSGWKTFTEANYSIQYPADWELRENTGGQSEFAILAAQESSKDKFRENINLVLEDLTGKGDVDLAYYASASKGQIETGIDKAVILQNNPVKGKYGEHHKMIYTGEQSGFALQFEQYYYVKGKMAYVLTFTTEQGRYDDYKDVGETILNTFKID